MVIKRPTQAGITLLEVIFLVAIAVLLYKLARPNYHRQRAMVQRGICLAQLERIDAAKRQWAEQTRMPAGAAIELKNLLPLLKLEELPRCPSGGTYQIHGVGQPATCDFAVSLDHKL
jgi:Tfp pilus assembly protein PilE